LFFTVQSFAQDSVEYSIPSTIMVNPESIGRIGQYRLYSYVIPDYKVTYSEDTGPWPPEFEKKKYDTGYTIGLGMEFGLVRGLDLLLYGSYGGYFFGDIGVRYQIIGGSPTEERPGFSLAVAGFFSPRSQKSYNSRSGCIIFCASWDERYWNINRSSEQAVVAMGYRWTEHWRSLLQFQYQRFRMDGTFHKYDSIGPRTFDYDLSNSGESKSVSATGAFDFKMGTKLRGTGYAGLTGVSMSNQNLESKTFAGIHAGFTFHFGVGMAEPAPEQP
jgi:hypothetical protein